MSKLLHFLLDSAEMCILRSGGIPAASGLWDNVAIRRLAVNANRPYGMTAGGVDRSVPAASVVRLADILRKLQPNVLLIHRESAGHSTNYEDGKAAITFVVNRVILNRRAE